MNASRRRLMLIAAACVISLLLLFASTPLCSSVLDSDPWQIIPSEGESSNDATPGAAAPATLHQRSGSSDWGG